MTYTEKSPPSRCLSPVLGLPFPTGESTELQDPRKGGSSPEEPLGLENGGESRELCELPRNVQGARPCYFLFLSYGPRLLGAQETAWWLKALTALLGDLDLIPTITALECL